MHERRRLQACGRRARLAASRPQCGAARRTRAARAFRPRRSRRVATLRADAGRGLRIGSGVPERRSTSRRGALGVLSRRRLPWRGPILGAVEPQERHPALALGQRHPASRELCREAPSNAAARDPDALRAASSSASAIVNDRRSVDPFGRCRQPASHRQCEVRGAWIAGRKTRTCDEHVEFRSAAGPRARLRSSFSSSRACRSASASASLLERQRRPARGGFRMMVRVSSVARRMASACS